MVVATVQGSEEGGHVPALVPEVAADAAAATLGTRDDIETELDIYLTALQGCWQMSPDQVLLTCSQITARCTELCVHLHRVEHRRAYRQLRTMQAERIIAECDRQFKFHSRIVEVMRQDLELSR